MPDIILFNLQNNNGICDTTFLEFGFCQSFGDVSCGTKEFIEYEME